MVPLCAKLSLQFMDVKLPKLGEGADSGVVVGIFVKEGDTVAKDQPILELENEKAVASIPSTAAGVVEKIHVKSGDRVSIGQKLITLAGGGGVPAAEPAPVPNAAAKKAVAKAAPEPVARMRMSMRRISARSAASRGCAGGVAVVAPDGARTGH